MIPVSQPFLPPIEEYEGIISTLWSSKLLTNNGIYVQKLENKLKEYLNLNSLHYVSNGTIALQLAIKALDIKGEVITTPFSFVATTSSIIWENCEPVFVDIDPLTLCIDSNKIEEAISEKTQAILATHVYGIPCNVEQIERIAKKYKLKIIYDAAQAFGVKYKGKSLLSFGDISTLSFHATKVFHTVEGGAIVNNSEPEVDTQIELMRSFGVMRDEYWLAGINGKNSEFHAVMGLCNIRYIETNILKRKIITEIYNIAFDNIFKRPVISSDVIYNYSYYPIIFPCEQDLLYVKEILERNKVQTRRYFYPSLNELPYLEHSFSCPISEDISRRVLCLPLFSDLQVEDAERIIHIITV